MQKWFASPRLNSLADFASGPSTGRQAARLLAELFRLPWPCTPSLHPLPVVFRDGRCVCLLRTLRGHRDCQSLVNLGKLVFYFKFQIPNLAKSNYSPPRVEIPVLLVPGIRARKVTQGPRSTATQKATTTAASEAKRHLAAGTREGGVGGGKAPAAARGERDKGPRGLVG